MRFTNVKITKRAHFEAYIAWGWCYLFFSSDNFFPSLRGIAYMIFGTERPEVSENENWGRKWQNLGFANENDLHSSVKSYELGFKKLRQVNGSL